jgi:hypothetical protein
MAEDHDLLLVEWLGILSELWKAVGKPLEKDRLEVYRHSLGEVPLGLLELAVRRVIRENTYHVVPPPGVVWSAVRQELGDPWDIRLALEDWAENGWGRRCQDGLPYDPGNISWLTDWALNDSMPGEKKQEIDVFSKVERWRKGL